MNRVGRIGKWFGINTGEGWNEKKWALEASQCGGLIIVMERLSVIPVGKRRRRGGVCDL